jgi:hypothetical protein
MTDRKQFSVLLNYNKNQSKSDASDFIGMYSKDIVLPPMSKVALYSASLIRKPIVLTTDQSFSLVLNDAYTYPQGQFEVNGNVPSVTIPIPAKEYSKREFLNELENATATAIESFMEAFPTKYLEYKPAVQIEKDSVFYSLTPYIVPEQFFPISETADASQNIDEAFDVGVAPLYDATDHNTWNNFAFARASIFPFTRNHREDYDTNQNNTDWFFKVDLRQSEECLCGFLPQSYQKTNWTDNQTVQTSDLVNSVAGVVPNCYFGLYFNKSNAGSDAVTCSIVASSDLSDRIDSEAPITSMVSLVDFEIENIASSGIFGFKIYYENTQNNQDTGYDNYYFKVYAKQTQSANYYQVTDEDVLFDSRTINLSLTRSLVIESFSADPVNGEYQGLVPFVAFKGVPNDVTGSTGSVTLNIMNINEVYDDDLADWRQSIGISRFNITNVSEELSYVFGFKEQFNLDPNTFPNVMNPDNGVVALYSDSIGYNIEITNLGIRTQNNTVNTNPGADRPCVYRIQNEETDLSTFNQVYRRITHYPTIMKFVDLENRDPLHLNNLNIKIRRDITNQQATEIEDTKIELVFI